MICGIVQFYALLLQSLFCTPLLAVQNETCEGENRKSLISS
jgi:hypothetical protein